MIHSLKIQKKSYDDMMANKCNICPGKHNTVGYHSTKISDEPVKYYLPTTAKKPYCIPLKRKANFEGR